MSDSYLNRFQDLSRILSAYRPFWQLIPFDYIDLPWQAENPALWTWLNGLSRDQIIAYGVSRESVSHVLRPFFEDMDVLNERATLPAISGHQAAYPVTLNRHIPGRKWEQIKAFADAIPMDDRPVLEWCAGKGHLGRLLSVTRHVPVTSLERNTALCEDGRLLAEKINASMTFHPCDVLTPTAADHIKTDQHAVALHACGELHLTLMRLACRTGCQAISIAPCCYHLIPDQIYQPLSTAGIAHDLSLRRFDLKLAVQEEVTATRRVRRLREVQSHWRLAFDLYQRDLTGDTTYRMVPTARESLLNTDMKSFFRWAAEACQLPLKASIDYGHYAARAAERRILISRIEFIRHLFRRPLEIWLILDRVLYLREQGYEVHVGEFCPRATTPRNILIHAEKAA